jgi:hypothetical protein
MEVRAVVAGGLEAEALELGRNVFGSDKTAPGPRRSSLERVVGQEFEMRPHHLTTHGPGDLAGVIGLLSRRAWQGERPERAERLRSKNRQCDARYSSKSDS